MAVYIIEIPEGSPVGYSQEFVERTIKKTFEFTDVTVEKKHDGSLKDFEQQQARIGKAVYAIDAYNEIMKEIEEAG